MVRWRLTYIRFIETEQMRYAPFWEVGDLRLKPLYFVGSVPMQHGRKVELRSREVQHWMSIPAVTPESCKCQLISALAE